MSFDMEYTKDGDPVIKKNDHPLQEQPDLTKTQETQFEQEATPDEVSADEQVVDEVSTTETPQTQPQETKAERNIRMIRQKAEIAEREKKEVEKERDEARSRLRYYELQMQQQQQVQPQVPQEPEADINLGSDELVEGKHFSQLGREVKRLKEQLKSYERQSQQSMIEHKIKASFPDFDSVVTQENIELLKQYDPLQADLIASSSDLYKQAVSAYNSIKRLQKDRGGYSNSYNDEQARIEKNMAKPRSTASISPQRGETPLSRANEYANGLTEELAAKLRKEMAENRRLM